MEYVKMHGEREKHIFDGVAKPAFLGDFFVDDIAPGVLAVKEIADRKEE